MDRIFNRSNLVVAASGTVTLEAAIAGTPTVIIYKVSPLSYLVGRLLVRVDRIGLVNLIADKELMPELIQGQASPERIAARVLRCWMTLPDWRVCGATCWASAPGGRTGGLGTGRRNCPRDDLYRVQKIRHLT